MPKPVRVKNPSRAYSPSWVNMLRGLTPRRTASSWPLHSRRGWLVMMAVIRSRRVGGPGGRGGVVRSRLVRPGLRSTGGVQMAMSIAVMGAGRGGRPSSRLRYREVAHLTLRALTRGLRAGSKVASTARPIAPGSSAGPSGSIWRRR